MQCGRTAFRAARCAGVRSGMAALMKRLAAATFICVCAELCASHRSLSSFRSFFSYSRIRSCGAQNPCCSRLKAFALAHACIPTLSLLIFKLLHARPQASISDSLKSLTPWLHGNSEHIKWVCVSQHCAPLPCWRDCPPQRQLPSGSTETQRAPPSQGPGAPQRAAAAAPVSPAAHTIGVRIKQGA